MDNNVAISHISHQLQVQQVIQINGCQLKITTANPETSSHGPTTQPSQVPMLQHIHSLLRWSPTNATRAHRSAEPHSPVLELSTATVVLSVKAKQRTRQDMRLSTLFLFYILVELGRSGVWRRCVRSGGRWSLRFLLKKGRERLDDDAHAGSELRFVLHAEGCHRRKLHSTEDETFSVQICLELFPS